MGQRTPFRERVRQAALLQTCRDRRESPELERLRGRVHALEQLSERERAEVRRLQSLPPPQDELACFRVAVRKELFGRLGGDLLSLSVCWDPRLVEYGLHAGARPGSGWPGDPLNLSAHVRYLIRDLTAQIERQLVEYLSGRQHPRRAQ